MKAVYIMYRRVGDDNNDGSLKKPFKTIQKALNIADAGATINVAEGTYAEALVFPKSGTAEKFITLQSNSFTKPVITLPLGERGVIIDLNGQSFIKISGFDIGNVSATEACGIFMGEGVHNVTISNNIIHNICTTLPDDSSNGGANGILCLGEGTSEASAIQHINICNNEVCNNVTGWSESISVAGNVNDVIVSGNIVHDNTNIGIDFYGNAGYCSVAKFDQPRNCEASNNTVYNCKCSYAENAGIYVDGARFAKIMNNTVYDNVYGIEIGSEEGYGKDNSTPVTNITVSGNYIHDNPSGGIRIGGYDVGISGTVMNSTISGNTLENNGAGDGGYCGEINIEKTSGIKITNNVIKKSDYSQNDYPMVVIGSDVPKKNITDLVLSGNTYYSILETQDVSFEIFGVNYQGLDTKNGFKNKIKSIPGGVCKDRLVKIQ